MKKRRLRKGILSIILTMALVLTMVQMDGFLISVYAATDETKTFTNSNITAGSTNQLNYDGNLFISATGNETVSKGNYNPYNIVMRAPLQQEGTLRLYPRISGKVKSIVFSSAYMFADEGYMKIGKGSTWTNSISEKNEGNNPWKSFEFTSADGIQLDNESDYLEIKLFHATKNGSFFSKGSITITYEPTASTLTHTHNFSYSKNGSTLTATCAHNDGKDCSLASDNWQISTTLTPPTFTAYGQYVYHTATLSSIAGFTTETGATVGDITYVNNTTGESLGTSMPHDIGAYTASVTINAGGTDYTLTTSYSVGTFCGINTNYPQFTTDKEGNYALDGETVTLTFTSLYGEILTAVTATGATSGSDITLTSTGANTYTFTMPQEEVNIGATFTEPDASHFEKTGENEYTIKTANGWNWFCFALNSGLVADGFSGKTVKLDADISSSEMAGTSGHPFKGTFDGRGNTLTFNLTASEGYSAPFHYINGATISNLHVEGTITGGTYESLGGLVGHAEGNITIENCRVSTQISTTVNGSALHGGVIAQWNGTNATCTVTGCVYDGLIYNPDEAGVTASCRGFIGWDYGNNGTITFTDCLSAPAAYGTGKYALGDNCFTFVYPNSEPTLTYNMTNCYYTRNLGKRQGRPATTATTAPANLGNATTDHGLVKGYENGFLYNGNYYTPKYGDAVVDYDFDEWNERANVTFNGDGNNLVGVNITEDVYNVTSVTYNRMFAPGVATTVILPFNYECNGNEGGTFYNFKNVTYDEDKHEWVCKIIAPGEAGSNNVTSLTANTPYLFMPTATKMTFPNIESMTGGVVTLLPTTLNEYGGATTDYNWNFYGTYTGKEWTGLSNDYGFAATNGTAVTGEGVEAGQFVRYTTNASIGPMRCYLRYAGTSEFEGGKDIPWWDYPDNVSAADTYKQISFSAGEGSGTKDVIYIPKNRNYILPECNFTAPDGKTFKGWSVKIGDAEAVSKQPNDTIEVTANTTVTAMWQNITSPIFRNHSVVLGGQIGVNFYLELAEIEGYDYADSYMEFTLNGKTTQMAFTSAPVDSKTGYRRFTCYLNSLQMADEIEAVFHYNNTETEANRYSVKTYVDYITSHESLYKPAEVALVKSIANYGHYTQPFIANYSEWTDGYNHETMPVAFEIDASAISIARAAVADKAIVKELEGSGLLEVQYSLSFGSETYINLYIKPNDGVTVQSVTCVDAKDVVKPVTTSQTGAYRKASINKINALDLGNLYTFTVNTSEGTATVKVYPMSYAYAFLNAEAYQDKTDVLQAMTALYQYYEATYNYVNAN